MPRQQRLVLGAVAAVEPVVGGHQPERAALADGELERHEVELAQRALVDHRGHRVAVELGLVADQVLGRGGDALRSGRRARRPRRRAPPAADPRRSTRSCGRPAASGACSAWARAGPGSPSSAPPRRAARRGARPAPGSRSRRARSRTGCRPRSPRPRRDGRSRARRWARRSRARWGSRRARPRRSPSCRGRRSARPSRRASGRRSGREVAAHPGRLGGRWWRRSGPRPSVRGCGSAGGSGSGSRAAAASARSRSSAWPTARNASDTARRRRSRSARSRSPWRSWSPPRRRPRSPRPRRGRRGLPRRVFTSPGSHTAAGHTVLTPLRDGGTLGGCERTRPEGSPAGGWRCSRSRTRARSSPCGSRRAGRTTCTTCRARSRPRAASPACSGSYLVLVELLLLARIPLLERTWGFERLAAIHRVNGRVALGLLLAHAALITAGYTIGDRISLLAELDRLITGYPASSPRSPGWRSWSPSSSPRAVAVRRRLRYETWHFVHLYAYLAVALALQPPARDRHGRSSLAARARAYWYALYGVDARRAASSCRLGVPLRRSLLAHRLRVDARGARRRPAWCRSRSAACGPATGCARGPASSSPGASSTATAGGEAHPFSLSAAPNGRRCGSRSRRVGDVTRRLRRRSRPGTRVIAEGPFGGFTAAARRPAAASLLIAGGVGITPIRALLEDMPGGPEDITVVYRAQRRRRRDPARRARRAGRPARGGGALRARRPRRRGRCSRPSACRR